MLYLNSHQTTHIDYILWNGINLTHFDPHRWYSEHGEILHDDVILKPDRRQIPPPIQSSLTPKQHWYHSYHSQRSNSSERVSTVTLCVHNLTYFLYVVLFDSLVSVVLKRFGRNILISLLCTNTNLLTGYVMVPCFLQIVRWLPTSDFCVLPNTHRQWQSPSIDVIKVRFVRRRRHIIVSET